MMTHLKSFVLEIIAASFIFPGEFSSSLQVNHGGYVIYTYFVPFKDVIAAASVEIVTSQ